MLIKAPGFEPASPVASAQERSVLGTRRENENKK
jgi:hypothetical protein